MAPLIAAAATVRRRRASDATARPLSGTGRLRAQSINDEHDAQLCDMAVKGLAWAGTFAAVVVWLTW